MRDINNIVLHCTATPQNTTVASIKNYWKSKGWKHPGYHFIIDVDGKISHLNPLSIPANGVRGHNQDSIHIAYTGGVDSDLNPLDNRTELQRAVMEGLVKALHAVFPEAKIKGHRQFPNVRKACPSFDVPEWLNEIKVVYLNT